MAAKKWQVYKRHNNRSLLDHLCQIRGISPDELEMDFLKHLHDPNLLPQMDVARRLIVKAVKEKWPVAIFGDYDADGTPAAALLASVCQRLGLIYEVYLPTRQTGYGLTDSFIGPIAEQAKLLITVDTGVTSVEAVEKLNSLGVKTIVLDHHLPPEGELPPAEAIVDPYLKDSKYPFPNICGCTLAYKLACALRQDFPTQLSEGFLKWQLDLVAISTVADMMEMRGENRPLVEFGLKVLKKTRRPGLAALMGLAGLNVDELSAGSLGFSIGPRFNAAGRMGDNRPVYDLLRETDSVKAGELARQIEQLNRERQDLVEAVLAQAEISLWQQNSAGDFVYVISGDGWSSGVVGLVAGKLAEKYYRPVVVGSRVDDQVRASARSVGSYPIIDGLSSVGSHLEQYGGHRQAAGLTARTGSWEAFATALKKHAKKYFDGILPRSSLKADDFLKLVDATLSQAQELLKLEPHGLGNPRPTFIIRDVELTDPQPVGAAKKHIQLLLTKDSVTLPAIGFSLAEKFATHKSNRADVAGHLTENIWNGNKTVQFQLIDFKHAGADVSVIDTES
ncbi:MAG: single-stranded-DNA-specific exonuclease RecJ [Candidatus Berkelbacteria bacterium]|nr:single-stranded-DNA-specific exonuclease RecJ [Candidatus Berkelbacteria bacterium]MCR4307842.1 single-stranded-DNA-specific exonuclease RecJ [Candidatus Berkelbacteria bacterium]